MKHVEENFKDAYTFAFFNEEVRYLKYFLREQINIESVLCILLKPEYKEIDRRYYDDCYASIDIKVIVHKESENLEQISRSINNARRCLPFISYIPTNEFKFYIMDINDFTSDSIIIKSWSQRDLVSSYILFDRNGTFEKMQDELKTTEGPWSNLCIIDNIDDLSVESTKKKVLSINN